MKSILRALYAAVFVLCAGIAPAHAEDLDPALKAKIDGYFERLQRNDPQAAYDLLFADTTMAASKPAEVQQLVTQTKAILTMTGPVLGWELISVKRVSPSYTTAKLLLKTEFQPMFFRFGFYRPKDKWVTQRIDFFDSLEKLPD